MQALVCNVYGSWENLAVEEHADPRPGPGEVLIEIRAAGINFPDLLSVSGDYQVKTPLPFIPGNEAAGFVKEVGDGVHDLAPGDPVVAALRGGAFAEMCVAPRDVCFPMPAGLDIPQAAAIAVTYGTSLHALQDCAKLAAGETVLVLGASGGVGSAAVQIAKTLGARVIAAVSNKKKVEFATQLGADAVIDYSEQALNESVKALTDRAGVDVIVDPVGGPYAGDALRALAWQGRYLVVGFAAGEIPAFPGNIVLLKEASIMGVWWGSWAAKNPELQARNMQRLSKLFVDRTLQAPVTKIFALAEFAEAFRTIAERRALGKVAFTM